MKPIRRIVTAALLLASAACDGGPEFSVDGNEAAAVEGENRFTMSTRGDEVMLGLTDEVVYFRLSDELLAQIDAEMKSDTENAEGLGALIAGAVTEGVGTALRARMQYRVDEIRDVRYEGGRLDFEFEDAGRDLDLEVDGNPVETQFAPEDARRFVEEFRALKR